MTIHELDTIVLVRDIPEHALRRGDLGAVVARLSPTCFEVEFVRISGETHALLEVDEQDLRPMEGGDLPTVR